LRLPDENSIALSELQSLNHSEPGPELPPLPPLPLQDEKELQALDPHNIFRRRNAISCEIVHTNWADQVLDESHETELEFSPGERSLDIVRGDSQMIINPNPFPPPEELWILPDTTYDPEDTMEEALTLTRYPPRPPSPEEHLIDPCSPLGKQVIQKIRDYFHIPANIGPSRFTDYFNEQKRISEGMPEDRILASPTSNLLEYSRFTHSARSEIR
jgi:hypothetical protein